MQWSLAVHSSQMDYRCEKKFLERKFDACRFIDSASTVPIISLFFNALEKTSNKSFRCPMKVGKFEVKDFTINGLLPFPSDTKFCVNVKIFLKTPTSRNVAQAFHFRVNATYKLRL